jgi:hypothetical protein
MTTQKLNIPWVINFQGSTRRKLEEFFLALSENVKSHQVYLSLQEVEEISFNPNTPDDVSLQFLSILFIARDMLKKGIPAYKIVYRLSHTGLNIVTI